MASLILSLSLFCHHRLLPSVGASAKSCRAAACDLVSTRPDDIFSSTTLPWKDACPWREAKERKLKIKNPQGLAMALVRTVGGWDSSGTA